MFEWKLWDLEGNLVFLYIKMHNKLWEIFDLVIWDLGVVLTVSVAICCCFFFDVQCSVFFK